MVVIGPQSSCCAIGWTVVIGPISNWPAIGWTVAGRGWIDIGGRGWIDTGSIRGGAAAVVVAVEAVAVAGWFIGCGRSTKGYQDRLFLLSYIYRVSKVIG
jgi:hypothetical protein